MRKCIVLDSFNISTQIAHMRSGAALRSPPHASLAASMRAAKMHALHPVMRNVHNAQPARGMPGSMSRRCRLLPCLASCEPFLMLLLTGLALYLTLGHSTRPSLCVGVM